MVKNGEPDPADQATPEWSELWKSFSDSSKLMADAWSSSVASFMQPQTSAPGSELSQAIEKMVQGPQPTDVWDIQRKFALVFSAWVEMRQKLAIYNAVNAPPWSEASKRFVDVMSSTINSDWREAFQKWCDISNEELIRNQRTDGFLDAQKELLRAGLQLRNRQDDLAEAAAVIFGLPSRKDFDDVTRQLTELRREVRAYVRRLDAKKDTIRMPALTETGES